jgi:GNAT superfamily N-acetyltransferase
MERALTYRLATENDLIDIINLLADDTLGSQREKLELPLPESYHKAFAAIANDPNQELTVAELNGELVGTFQLSFIQYLTYQGSRRAQIEAVRVGSSYRGSMFRYAISRAKEEGCSILQLTTDKKRPQALLFYESMGFVATHEGMKRKL